METKKIIGCILLLCFLPFIYSIYAIIKHDPIYIGIMTGLILDLICLVFFGFVSLNMWLFK